MNARDIEIAELLSVRGIQFSHELKDEVRPYFQRIDAEYFPIAVALSLTWTHHAKLEFEFVEYAAQYVQGDIDFNATMSIDYSHLHGAEELDLILLNYRMFFNQSRHMMIDFRTCNVRELTRFQNRLLDLLVQLRASHSISHIGPWLFTGPFKIILTEQERFWTLQGINAIILPTGNEVDRGIMRLVGERYTFVDQFDINWLGRALGNRSLVDDYATYTLVHSFVSTIGQITNTITLHINSALFLYGKNQI